MQGQQKFSLKEFQSPEYFSHPFNIIPYFQNHFRKHLCFKPQSSRNISPYLFAFKDSCLVNDGLLNKYCTSVFLATIIFLTNTLLKNLKFETGSEKSNKPCFVLFWEENWKRLHFSFDTWPKVKYFPHWIFMRECTFHTLFKFASTLYYS